MGASNRCEQVDLGSNHRSGCIRSRGRTAGFVSRTVEVAGYTGEAGEAMTGGGNDRGKRNG